MLTFTASETFDGQGEPGAGGFGDGGEAAAPVACAVPRLKREARAADFERVVFGGEGKQFLAGFEQGGLTGAGEEALDLGAYGRQIAGNDRLHWTNTASI